MSEKRDINNDDIIELLQLDAEEHAKFFPSDRSYQVMHQRAATELQQARQEIADLTKKGEDLCAAHGQALLDLAARDARIAELEGGLPVTEEGDHVYLGMTVWSDGSPLDSGVVTKVQKDCYVVDRSSVGCSTWVFMSGEGYSTREAAEAARSTPDGKGGE